MNVLLNKWLRDRSVYHAEATAAKLCGGVAADSPDECFVVYKS